MRQIRQKDGGQGTEAGDDSNIEPCAHIVRVTGGQVANQRGVSRRAIVTCFVTPPIWGPATRIDRYLTEYLESTNRAAPIEWTHKTGSGYESDVRIAQNMKGVYSYTRILTTLAEDGRRHLVILSSTGLNEEETRLTLEGLVTARQ